MRHKINIEELIGREFGRLTVIGEGEPKLQGDGHYRKTVRCKCNCENKTIIDLYAKDLLREDKTRKATRSCGCLWRESLRELPQLFQSKINTWSEQIEDEHGEYYIGITENTKNKFYIDAEDYEKVNKYCWSEHVDQTGYHCLITKIKEKQVKMTKILGFSNMDHEDRNPLNNRKYNIREASNSQQMLNRGKRKDNKSGIVGVRYINDDHRIKCWYAELKVNKQKVLHDLFLTKEEAIKARLQAEADYAGEFAPQKHLFEQYGIKSLDKLTNP